MDENSIDWKNDELFEGSLETCVKKNLKRDKILGFVAREFPRYGKWSMTS